ncbi:MAG: hydrogenase 4 subunit F [Burkholderiaceae bacterium]|nr:hydrogenase 4 subunit F [Burkholderiaceae bacterium]
MVLAIPLLGCILMGLIGHREIAPEINAGLSLGTFIAVAVLSMRIVDTGSESAFNELFFVDSLNIFLVFLTAFVGLTTSLFSRPYMRVERDIGRMTAVRTRIYHSMYQLFMFTMLLALLTNNIGILWVSMEIATLSAVLLVSIYRTAAALEAAWKYFILCGVGISLALFGTILIYLAAERQLGGSTSAFLWTNLNAIKTHLEPAIMSIAFVFLLVGYGTKMGLVPLHSWLPDAHAEGPTPVSAVLSGLLLNVALYTVLRFKILADSSLQNGLPGNILVGFGLVSVVVASFSLSQQKDVKRMFSYSSIEHIGLMTFAFGLGGPIATFAGLLHMTVHSLVKSAIFFTVGHACQKAGTQVIANIRGLVKVSPTVGWGLVVGALAILGMPPFGVFASEFLIITTSMAELPWATPILLLGLGVAFATIFRFVQSMAFGEPTVKPLAHPPALLPVFIHLGLALMLGLYIPPYLNKWFWQATNIITG